MHYYVGHLLQEPICSHMETRLDLPQQQLDDVTVEQISGELSFLHTSEGILVSGLLTVDMVLECVRCLSPVRKSLRVELEETFRPVAVAGAVEDRHLVIDVEGYLDIASVLRQEVIISTPMRVLCHRQCRGLCPSCGQNLNQGLCECHSEKIDPRMAVLQQLLEQ